jgi:hypothetical protein
VLRQHARQALDHARADGQADAEFQQQPMDLVGRLDTVPSQRFPDPVIGAQYLLLLGLGRDKPHGWPRCRFADGFSVDEIVLVGLTNGFTNCGEISLT